MDDAIRIEDITGYIQRRRAYLSVRRESAETPVDKGKIIGMLQALADFEGMARQLQVTGGPSPPLRPALHDIQYSCENLANQWLSALALPGACLDNFRDDARQNRLVARHPEKRQGIVSLGQLLRNQALVDVTLDQIRAGSRGGPSAHTNGAGEKSGGTCPHCGKTYKYAKALATHVAGCPQNPSSG